MTQIRADVGREMERLFSPEFLNRAYGARMLKRVIDDRVKLPISLRWREGTHFHVGVDGSGILVEPSSGISARSVQAVA